MLLTRQKEGVSRLKDEIQKLKLEKHAVILAHYYQSPDIQDIADFLGDSLQLAQAARKSGSDIIVFAGVHFMAETAKILNQSCKVLIPDMSAGCSLADHCQSDQLISLKNKHPDHIVVSYINCSAEVKAQSDILCTSSNAEKVINSIPKNLPILFAPDRHLGRWLEKRTGRSMLLWDGACIVHEHFDLKRLIGLKAEHPNARVIAHPECPDNVLAEADFVGSTTALLNYARNSKESSFIVVTEPGIIHQMKISCAEKTFYAVPSDGGCSCNDCPYMKLNTLEKVRRCLLSESPEIVMEQALIAAARIPLERMLAIDDIAARAKLWDIWA